MKNDCEAALPGRDQCPQDTTPRGNLITAFEHLIIFGGV